MLYVSVLSFFPQTEMGLQNQNMNMVLSTDAKPRLKWTAELHQRFLEAVSQLGGSDKATPKGLMRAMGVPGLTLYHLKSHLQKHRLGKSLFLESCNDHKQEGDLSADETESEVQSQDMNLNQNNESLHMTQAWRMQLEVQRKLEEQIEVQRHLQLRIEAQGKYLQSVLQKAHETLAGYNSSSVGTEHVKSELSHLVSMVSSGSSLSGQLRRSKCSIESSLTSSESSGHKEEKQQGNDSTSSEPPLKESDQASGRKRNADMISDEHCVEQELPKDKRSSSHKGKKGNHEWCGMLDLNRQYESDVGSGSETMDLNTRE